MLKGMLLLGVSAWGMLVHKKKICEIAYGANMKCFSQDSPISAQTLNSGFLDHGWEISITTAIAQTDLL